jgi:pyruvate-formate lyase
LASIDVRVSVLKEEIDEFLLLAISGKLEANRILVRANKVYDESKFSVSVHSSGIGEAIESLLVVNLALWKEQEKVYNFEQVPADMKDIVIRDLAQLNLDRNALIEKIDETLLKILSRREISE